MRRQRLTFSGSQGTDLAGELDLPDNPPRAIGIFTPCFTCNKNYKGPRRIAAALAEMGWGVLRFDPTGFRFERRRFRSDNVIVGSGRFMRCREPPRNRRAHAPRS